MSNKAFLDALARQLGEISFARKNVRSFLVVEKAEIPDKVSPEDIPCVISYPMGTGGDWSAGGSWEYTFGRSDFFVTPSNNRSQLSTAVMFHDLIRNKFLESLSLNGACHEINLIEGEGQMAIVGPREMRWRDNTDDPWMWGYTVYWRVKEIFTPTQIPVGA